MSINQTTLISFFLLGLTLGVIWHFARKRELAERRRQRAAEAASRAEAEERLRVVYPQVLRNRIRQQLNNAPVVDSDAHAREVFERLTRKANLPLGYEFIEYDGSFSLSKPETTPNGKSD